MVKTQKFMFFDDWPYEYRRGFQKKQGYPLKDHNNPIVTPVLPHEFDRISLYGTVLYAEDLSLFKMWYPTFSGGDYPIDSYLCYATSEDGIHFDKPALDIVKGTNIVLDKEYQVRGPSIIYDKEEVNPAWRYKMLMRPGHIPSTCAYVSEDGLHWNLTDVNAINANSDSHVGLIRHPETGLYMATARKIKGDRRVWLSTSTDFIHFTDPVLIKELPVSQSMQTQIYGMQIASYGPYILGMVSYYNTLEDDLDGWGKMDGTIDMGFAYSRGGYCWHDPFVNDRFIKAGDQGEWDSGMILPSSHPIFLKDRILFYYSGMPVTHKPPYPVNTKQCIGVASLRPDGFIYLEASTQEASLLTRIFTITKDGFSINADASKGEISIALCDGEGKAIKGFESEKCHPIKENGINLPISWGKDCDTSVLLNRALRIRIKAKNAKIYSITMNNGHENPDYRQFEEIKYAGHDFIKNDIQA